PRAPREARRPRGLAGRGGRRRTVERARPRGRRRSRHRGGHGGGAPPPDPRRLPVIEGDVVAIGADLAEVARHILNRMLSGGGELVTLIAGAHAPPGLAAALEEHLGETRPDVEVGVYDGG